MSPAPASTGATVADPGTDRAGATAKRRREILDAALRCFTEKGYGATTIADVRERSGASTGSVYHHFGSKEELAAALYLEGLRDYQAGAVRVLRRNPGAEEGVRAVVAHHLRWVARNRELARYLMASREPEVALASARPLRELNRAFLREVGEWLGPHLRARRLKELPTDLFYAVVLGPSQEFARLWVAERTSSSLERAQAELGEAAWRAVRRVTLGGSGL